MEKPLSTAACQLEPVLSQEPLCMLMLFTILTWFITKLQKFLPSSCQSCSFHISKTTSTPVLVDTNICKELNKNGDDETDMTYSDAEAVMRNIIASFDQENTSLESISHLFDEDEPSLEEVKMAFMAFDDNNDGYIDASDLHGALMNIGLGEGIGIKECDQMIARYDMNQDKRIDLMEFTKVLEASIC